MEHHETWFSALLGTFYKNAENAARAFSWPFNDEGKTLNKADIGVEHLFGSALVLLIVILIAFFSSRRVREMRTALVPDSKLTLRTFVELLVGATYDMMVGIMGPKAARFFLPLIGTCAFLILFSNLLGLIPGFLPPTDKLNTTLAYASIIFVSTHVFGVKEHGLAYFKHFFGPIIKWYALPLMLLMFCVEIISHLVRPASLSIRLMANMTADHMVLGLFLGLVPFIVPIPMYMLGTLVCIVQTLVFCMLSTVYISTAIAHEEH